MVETLEQIGDRLARGLGLGDISAKGQDAWVSLVRRLSGLPVVWFSGWYESSASVEAGRQENNCRWAAPADWEATVVTVTGKGVSRYSRERSVRLLMVWHLSPEPRPVELDAWAVTVLSSWGWRVVGSRRGSSGSIPL